ncbi:ATP-binding protein [Actinoplanes aureus]|uniref:ATP-binding protein n=1 Tax=Actinoplanes aureus TaxID=2792083 RepID=A0A931CIL0_9ACTN|nr:ATP-binding protein [Actinoplanes aureus]MBG0567998.1 ATP-binding protein [Actinoplanes aureus]
MRTNVPMSGGRRDHPPDVAWLQHFDGDGVSQLRRTLHCWAERAGLDGDTLEDFLTAAYELITNAVRHGGGHGTVHVWTQADAVVCEVRDEGPGFSVPPPATLRPPAANVPGGRGLWLAQQLTHTLTLQSSKAGVTASVTVLRQAQASAGQLRR